MADETRKETVILDFQIKQGDALNELTRTKKAILELKGEQKDLQDSYKTGKISLDAYLKSQVQLEAALKKTQSEYNNIQKSVTGLKSPFDKLGESIKEQAKSVSIAGVSLQSFANPVTATVAVLGSLYKAYANSTVGAKDLEFASNKLSAHLKLISNQLAESFSSDEDGKGFFSSFLNKFDQVEAGLIRVYAKLGIISKEAKNYGEIATKIALNQEKLEDLQRDETKILTDNADRRSENLELMIKLKDNEISFSERQKISQTILDNALLSQKQLLAVKKAEYDVAKENFSFDEKDEVLKNKLLDAENDLSNAKKATTKEIKQAQIEIDNLRESENKRLALIRQQNSEIQQQANLAKLNRSILGDPRNKGKFDDLAKDAATKLRIDTLDIENNATKEFSKTQEHLTDVLNKQKKAQDALTAAKAAEIQRLLQYSSALGVVQNAFESNTIAYKAAATAKATIDTYLGADAMLATLPFPANFIAAGAVILAGLENVSKIIGAGFEEGGFTGYGGRNEYAGSVHKGEVVWNQDDVAAVGGPHAANRMRPTYSDGGISMPSIANMGSGGGITKVIFVENDYSRFKSGVDFKEQASTL